jgi:virulence-associated protein VapD
MNGLNKDDIVKMVKEAGFYRLQGSKSALYVLNQEHIEKFAQLVAAAEREACAKVSEKWGDPMDAAAQIRARGQK